MFLAIDLEIKRAMEIARIEEARIVARISGRFWRVRFVIWLIAKAAPVRDFWKRISVRKEVAMTRVLIEPKRIKNCSFVVLPEISEATIVAWEDPSPGRREQIGEMRIVEMVGLISSFLLRFNFSIFCFGMIVFCFMEWIRLDVAKSPVRRGRRGWFTFKFRVAMARNPARRNIIVAFSLDFFSVIIRKIAIQIRRMPIIRSRSG